MTAETRLIPAWQLLDREGLHALVETPRRGLPEGIFLNPNRALHEISIVPLVMAALSRSGIDPATVNPIKGVETIPLGDPSTASHS